MVNIVYLFQWLWSLSRSSVCSLKNVLWNYLLCMIYLQLQCCLSPSYLWDSTWLAHFPKCRASTVFPPHGYWCLHHFLEETSWLFMDDLYSLPGQSDINHSKIQLVCSTVALVAWEVLVFLFFKVWSSQSLFLLQNVD